MLGKTNYKKQVDFETNEINPKQMDLLKRCDHALYKKLIRLAQDIHNLEAVDHIREVGAEEAKAKRDAMAAIHGIRAACTIVI
jgi:hypothetical protein